MNFFLIVLARKSVWDGWGWGKLRRLDRPFFVLFFYLIYNFSTCNPYFLNMNEMHLSHSSVIVCAFLSRAIRFQGLVMHFSPFKKHSSVISSSFALSISSNMGKNKHLLNKDLVQLAMHGEGECCFTIDCLFKLVYLKWQCVKPHTRMVSIFWICDFGCLNVLIPL